VGPARRARGCSAGREPARWRWRMGIVRRAGELFAARRHALSACAGSRAGADPQIDWSHISAAAQLVLEDLRRPIVSIGAKQSALMSHLGAPAGAPRLSPTRGPRRGQRPHMGKLGGQSAQTWG